MSNLKVLSVDFYEFDQNNSGGTFDVDENVCHRVIIEATSQEHACAIFEPMIYSQTSSCACCGDRWSPEYADKINIAKIIQDGWKVTHYSTTDISDPTNKLVEEMIWADKYGIFPRTEDPTWHKSIFGSSVYEGKIYFTDLDMYLMFMANEYGWTTPDIRVHYLDGTKKEFFTTRRSDSEMLTTRKLFLDK